MAPKSLRKPVIVFGMNTGFAVRQFLPEVVEVARRSGLLPVVLAPGGPPCGNTGRAFSRIDFRSVPIRREISPLSDLWCLCRIWAILISLKPAITNMSTPKMALLGGLAAWLARVPRRIYTLRGLRYQTTRSWKRLLLIVCERISCACAHQVICISLSVKQAAVHDRICRREKLALLGETVSEGISVGPPTESPLRQALDLRRQCGIPDGARVIGFVGRLTRDKGIADLAAAFKLLQKQGLPVHLLLVGDFEPGDPVDEGTVSWIRSSPAVHWLGYVPQPRPYYELMDVFVFPTHREGLGRVLLEAAAAGKPAVSTFTTGVVDVVRDGITGILVPPGNPEALAEATTKLLCDGDLARRMGDSARALVVRSFDNSVYLERLGRMLASLTSPRLDAMSECQARGHVPALTRRH